MQTFSDRLQQSWWSDKAWLFLLPFSWLFGLIIRLRYWLYRCSILKSEKLPVTTIVIGNLVVGGVGKTPLTIFLAEWLIKAGKKPGILSRGYGGNYQGVLEVWEESDATLCGDEPLLLKHRLGCPVFVCRKRGLAGKALLSRYPECDVLICDDGLQHLSLKADIRLAVFDKRGCGNGQLLPAGPLREPLDQIKRLDAVFVNGEARHQTLQDIQIPLFHMTVVAEKFCQIAHPSHEVTASFFDGKILDAVAGIGNPQRFFDTLSALKIDYRPHSFRDHHCYTASDFKFFSGTILMTEKDSVKCKKFSQANWYFLSISVKLPIEWTTWWIMKTALLECLVCPLCKGKLHYNQNEQTLTCQADKLIFPIQEGIPVLLVSEASSLEDEQ